MSRSAHWVCVQGTIGNSVAGVTLRFSVRVSEALFPVRSLSVRQWHEPKVCATRTTGEWPDGARQMLWARAVGPIFEEGTAVQRIEQLLASYSERDKALQRQLGAIQAWEEQLAEFRASEARHASQSEVWAQAAAVVRQYADARQEEVHSQIQTLVTQGLTQIFQEDLRLVITQKVIGKRTDVEFKIASTIGGNEVVTPIMDARGGGVAAVAGFLLRVIMLLLTPNSRKILFLDESFAQVSAEYEPRLAEFVSELADRFGVQFLMVTHSNAFDDVSDAVFRTKYLNGSTTLEKMS